MEYRAIVTNATAEEIRAAKARMAAALPPPEQAAADAPPREGHCVHAHDTGEPAFVGLPCRGNRIECQKTGVVTYAARCRADKCRFYEEERR